MATRGASGKNPVGRPKRLPSGEGEDARARVLKAAEMLLEQRGYAGLSMEDVAVSAGMTKATVYHHFKGGKDGLIVAVGLEMIERHKNGIQEAIASASAPKERLESIARWVFEQGGQTELILRDAARFLPASHCLELYTHFMEGFYAPIENVLREGVAAGQFRAHDTSWMTCTFLTLLSGFEAHRATLSSLELARRVVDFTMNGIKATGE